MSDALHTPVPLAGPDARILHRLAQIVAMGKREGSYSPADVQRVAEAHLQHPHALRRQLLNERARADQLAAEVERLRATVRAMRGRRAA